MKTERKQERAVIASDSKSAHRGVFYKTSEFIGLVQVLAAGICQLERPWTVVPAMVIWARIVGMLLVLTGTLVLRLTHRELGHYAQPHQPGLPTSCLVQTGPFYYSRNPTYTAILLSIAPGIGLIWNNAYVLLSLPLCAVIFYVWLIREEEAYLRTRFGKEWHDYCSRTRRWL